MTRRSAGISYWKAIRWSPRRYAKDHPLIEDLKRKDFIGVAALSEKDPMAKDLRLLVAKRFEEATPYMRFLCKALELQF